MDFEISFEREDDGRWIAEVEAIPGVLVYGSDQTEARIKAEALALQVMGREPLAFEKGRNYGS